MPATGDQFQSRVTVGAGLLLLLHPRLVADGRSQLQTGAVGQGAAPRTHHHAQARLLEDVAVVVVGVAHGPAAQVALRLLLVAAVDEAHVAVGPLAEAVEVGWLLERRTAGGAVRLIKPKPGTSRFLFCPSTLESRGSLFNSRNVVKPRNGALTKGRASCVCLSDNWL